jgi:hypothetical protein
MAHGEVVGVPIRPPNPPAQGVRAGGGIVRSILAHGAGRHRPEVRSRHTESQQLIPRADSSTHARRQRERQSFDREAAWTK